MHLVQSLSLFENFKKNDCLLNTIELSELTKVLCNYISYKFSSMQTIDLVVLVCYYTFLTEMGYNTKQIGYLITFSINCGK